MESFNKAICLSNIYYLAKKQGVKIGDLESAAGVSAGYISRLNKEDNTSSPSIEAVVAIARKLEIPLDALLSRDYSALTSAENYLLQFLDKLLLDTTATDLIWEREPVAKICKYGVDEDGYAIHPLFIAEDDGTAYNSLFHEGESIGLLADGYKVELQPRKVLYIMAVGVETGESMPKREYELYSVVRGRPSPICHSVWSEDACFNKRLEEIYAAAAESSKLPKIDPEVKDLIDGFMEDFAGMELPDVVF